MGSSNEELTKLTVKLPKEDLAFVQAYARDHGLSVDEVIARYFHRMRELAGYQPSDEVKKIVGLVSGHVDAKEEYHRHQLRKHA